MAMNYVTSSRAGSRKNRAYLLAFASAAVLAASAAAAAETPIGVPANAMQLASATDASRPAPDANSDTVAEVVVTAQKRTQDLISVPVSVTAVSAQAVQ